MQLKKLKSSKGKTEAIIREHIITHIPRKMAVTCSVSTAEEAAI